MGVFQRGLFAVLCCCGRWRARFLLHKGALASWWLPALHGVQIRSARGRIEPGPRSFEQSLTLHAVGVRTVREWPHTTVALGRVWVLRLEVARVSHLVCGISHNLARTSGLPEPARNQVQGLGRLLGSRSIRAGFRASFVDEARQWTVRRLREMSSNISRLGADIANHGGCAWLE